MILILVKLMRNEVRMMEKITYRYLIGNGDRKRRLRRLTYICKDNIKMNIRENDCSKVKYIELTLRRTQR
jgi:hypothetical protein